MAALVSFVGTYAIWIYLVCALGVLVGIKLLTDARRLARTTLFSLDQERAGEQTFRAILLMLSFFATMAAVAFLNSVVSGVVPTSESAIIRGTTPTQSALVFPSNTPAPSSTPTLVKPTETPFLTSTPTLATTSTRPPATKPVITTAAQLPSATVTSGVPVPALSNPLNNMVTQGLNRANADLTFQWKCDRCLMAPSDRYVLVISFVDKRTGFPRSVGGGTKDTFYTMASILAGTSSDVYQQAKDDSYTWYVEVRRDDQPLSKSEVWRFTWH